MRPFLKDFLPYGGSVEDLSLALNSNNLWTRKFDFRLNDTFVFNELISHLKS